MKNKDKEHNTVSLQQAMVSRLLVGVLLVSRIAAPPVYHAQSSRTVLDVFNDNLRTATDEFVVSKQRTGDRFETTLRSDVTLTNGVQIAVEASFDSVWQPLQIQFSRDGSRTARSWTQFAQRKITFRSVTRTGETAREFSRRGRFVLIDPQAPSLLHVLQFVPVGPVTVLSPSNASRAEATLLNHGIIEKTFGDVSLAVRHVELVLPEGSTHAWYDETGGLVATETEWAGRSTKRRR